MLTFWLLVVEDRVVLVALAVVVLVVTCTQQTFIFRRVL
jgi:hypothetical protein